LAGGICIFAALLGRVAQYQVYSGQVYGRSVSLRLFCCPQDAGAAAVYNFRTVHSAEKWAPVGVNLVDLRKIRGVIFRQLIRLGELENGRKKTARSKLNELFLHLSRTCYWHPVASMGAVRGGPDRWRRIKERTYTRPCPHG
jgi:hypothetical protein